MVLSEETLSANGYAVRQRYETEWVAAQATESVFDPQSECSEIS